MSDIMELVERLRGRQVVSFAWTAEALNLIDRLNADRLDAASTIERLVAERDEARRHLYLVRNDRDNLSDHVHLAESRCERLVDRKCPCRPPSSGEE